MSGRSTMHLVHRAAPPVLIAVLTGALLSTCATLRGARGDVAGLKEVQVGDVRELLESGDPIQALGALDTLERQGLADPAERAALRERALLALDADFRVALGNGSVEHALALATTRAALGLEPFRGEDGVVWDRAALLRESARRAQASGPEVLAVHYGLIYAAEVGLAAVPAEERAVFLASLRALKDPAALRHAERLLAGAGTATATPQEPIPLSEAMKGTVTVLVDQGLRIESRVGLPNWVQGSGFFISPSGYLLTNYHVVASEVDPEYEGFSRLYVSRGDSSTERIPAKVVGYDPILDLALVKVEITSEYAYYPGLQTDLRSGEEVLAIGSPVSLVQTVSSGIVSYMGRRFLQLGDVMQISAPVNPGNSGGPLLDKQLRLVGVVFAGIEQTQGLNFAIPARWISSILPRLFAGGRVVYAWLGTSVDETDAGLEVVYVVPGSPAHRAGIQEGDILVSVAGEDARRIADAQGRLMELTPPCLVQVEWTRGTERRTAVVALEERPDNPVETALELDTRERLMYPLFGMKLERVGQSFGKTRYVVKRVLEGSQAAQIGLTLDDPLSIEGWRVDHENKIAQVNIYVKKKSSGYLEGVVGLEAYLEQDTFL